VLKTKEETTPTQSEFLLRLRPIKKSDYDHSVV